MISFIPTFDVASTFFKFVVRTGNSPQHSVNITKYLNWNVYNERLCLGGSGLWRNFIKKTYIWDKNVPKGSKNVTQVPKTGFLTLVRKFEKLFHKFKNVNFSENLRRWYHRIYLSWYFFWFFFTFSGVSFPLFSCFNSKNSARWRHLIPRLFNPVRTLIFPPEIALKLRIKPARMLKLFLKLVSTEKQLRNRQRKKRFDHTRLPRTRLTVPGFALNRNHHG